MTRRNIAIPLEALAATQDALFDRNLRIVAASMRYGRRDPQAAPDGFDVTLAHATGKGAACTGSGPTLLDAITRAAASFDRYIRPELEARS